MIIVTVMSGKGGTGKTTIATNLALSLGDNGFDVGLLDVDMLPDVPKMFGMSKVGFDTDEKGDMVLPILVDNIKVMSVGFDLTERQHVRWDGERIRQVISEFIKFVKWGDLDFLIIDMPPNTSDEYIEVESHNTNNLWALMVIISTPTGKLDAIKTLNMLKERKIPVIGIIENFSGMMGKGGGEELGKMFEVPFLGAIEYHKEVIEDLEKGKNEYLRKVIMPPIATQVVKATEAKQ